MASPFAVRVATISLRSRYSTMRRVPFTTESHALIPLPPLRRARAGAQSARAPRALACIRWAAPLWTPRDYVALTREGYERNAVVLSLRAHGGGGGRRRALARSMKGARKIADHPLLRLLARPNPRDTSVCLHRGARLRICCCIGNAYVEGAFVDGLLRELYACGPTA